MSRLIDADMLEPSEVYTGYGFTQIVYMDDIDEMPTVDIDAITETHEKIGFDKGYREGYAQATVDAEPVVRCKDCIHYDESEWTCLLHESNMKPTDFCSYGETNGADRERDNH